MKHSLNKIIIGLSLMTVFLATSCKKALFPPGINTDPNASTKANLIPQVLLPGVEYSLGYTIGGDVSRFSSTLIQSVRGVARQFQAYDQYVFTAQDFDNCWSNFYAQGLNDAYTLINLSDAKGYNYYSGISRIMMAYGIATVTDMWGDVPYSTAFRGDSAILQPTYDKQQLIYDSIFVLLNKAITQLSGSAGSVVPGSDDFVYGGDPTEWTKLAYALEARYYLHLSKVNANYADNILTALANAFTSNADNAAVPFFNNNTQANPWYQYVTQRGDIGYTEGNVYAMMNADADPRLPLFIDTTAADGGDNIGNAIGNYNAPVTIMSYTEQKFIEAEARLAKSDPTAAAAYDSALTSSFTSLGLSEAQGLTYVVANPLTGLQRLITQKYLALFTQPESFNDWRRTGFPALTPVTGTAIPRRWLYVQAELDHNATNVPSGTTLYTKVWWDQ